MKNGSRNDFRGFLLCKCQHENSSPTITKTIKRKGIISKSVALHKNFGTMQKKEINNGGTNNTESTKMIVICWEEFTDTKKVTKNVTLSAKIAKK